MINVECPHDIIRYLIGGEMFDLSFNKGIIRPSDVSGNVGKIIIDNAGTLCRYTVDIMTALYLYNNRVRMLYGCGKVFICSSSYPYVTLRSSMGGRRGKYTDDSCLLLLENESTLSWHDINGIDLADYSRYLERRRNGIREY